LVYSRQLVMRVAAGLTGAFLLIWSLDKTVQARSAKADAATAPRVAAPSNSPKSALPNDNLQEAGPNASGSTIKSTNAIIQFAIEGTTVTEVYQSGDTLSSREVDSVVFSYSNQWWRLETAFREGYHPRIPEGALEGQVASYERIHGGVSVLNVNLRSFIPYAWLQGDLYPDEFPPPENSNSFLSWLTLCPKPTLPFLSNSTMRRLISADFLRSPQNVGTFGIKNGPGNYFVSELNITNNGIEEVYDGTFRTNSPPFDHGHYEFQYQVLATTNWNGLIIPSSSILHKFGPTRNATARDEVRTMLTSTFVMSSIRGGDLPDPQIGANQVLVHDYRKAKYREEPTTFTWTNENYIPPAVTITQSIKGPVR
jgi:hypothetical protein